MSQQATWLRNHSELGMALLLGVVGAVVIADALSLNVAYSHADPVGPKTLPFIVGGLLLLCAGLLSRDVLRGGHGEAEEGEDVDLSRGTDWRTILPLLAFFGLNILLIDVLGWVISGALLFWGSVWSLGSRRYLRDAVIAVLLAVLTFYGFYLGLGIKLPAGLLEGVL